VPLFGKTGGNPGKFGSCCPDLRAALHDVPQSLFHVSEEGVLYLSIGMADTEQGVAFFDQALIYCPFCGRRLQDKAEIAKRTGDQAH